MTDQRLHISKAAVIGAGVMGAGIAAHIANAGINVVLLDIVPRTLTAREEREGSNAPGASGPMPSNPMALPPGAISRSAIAHDAIQRLQKADPAPLMHPRNAKRIAPGNLEDDLDTLSDCDWIVEAVVEDLAIKQDLYRKLDKVRKPGSVVSSNTSTLPLAQLTKGMSARFRRDFLITHFFNPPRYMRLLEIVTGPDTRPGAVSTVRDFADMALGKTVVPCHDTPGFIANRIGTFWLQASVVEAIDRGLSIEEADAVIGKPLGIPKTGVFGLLDLVGIDLMPRVLSSLKEALPETDAFQAIYRAPEMIEGMIGEGYTGRKGKGGFYRLNREGGGKVKEARDLSTGAYAKATKPDLASVRAAKKGGPRALMEHGDKASAYAWAVMSKTLAYAADLVGEIADDIVAVDAAMCLGYNWKYGPFELMDKLGPAWVAERLEADGTPVPEILKKVGAGTFYRVTACQRQYFTRAGRYVDLERPEGVLLLDDVKCRTKPLAKNRSASLWDIGDGVVVMEFHSKMNAINPFILSMVHKAIGLVAKDHKALVIYNEGSNFSVGANIGLLVVPAMLKLKGAVGWMVGQGQKAYQALKYAPFPVVAAPSGLALGGGCEILLHSDAVQAHAETYTGLVEAGVGVIPAWGGCKELLARWATDQKAAKGPMPPVIKAFETISMAKVAKSAEEARSLHFLRADDGITMNRDRLLADAKRRALDLAEGYAAPEPQELRLPGPSGRIAMEMAVDGFKKQGIATDHDTVVAGALAQVLSGGETDVTETVTEDGLLDLEREHFKDLTMTAGTLARVRHMLSTGKPLRN